MKVRITGYTEPFTWYKGLEGTVYTVIFDSYIGKYMALDNGGASRYIEAEDCETVETQK